LMRTGLVPFFSFLFTAPLIAKTQRKQSSGDEQMKRSNGTGMKNNDCRHLK
jgi:hypothetical protein